MADDGPSAAEDATAAVATGLGDGDSRVTRERHKRADATTPIVTSGQDASSSFVERVGVHEDASSSASPCEPDDHHRSHQSHHERRLYHRHQHQHQHPRHSYHHSSSHYCNHTFLHRHHLANHCDHNDRVSGDSSSPVDATEPTASDGEEENGGSDGISLGASCGGVGVGADGDDDDDDDGGGGSGGGNGNVGNGSDSVGLYHDDVRIEVVRSVVAEDDHDNDDGDGGNGGSVGGVDSDCDGDSAGSAGSSNSSIKSSKSGAGGVAAEIMTGGNNNNNNAGTRVGVEDADGTSSSPSTRLSAPSADSAPEVNDREDRDADRRTVIIAVATKEEETTRATEESPSASASASASAKTDNAGVAVARHQGSPFKGQVRMAEDTLVGPCGKKRCADRYDSSESSDSGVAVSCGECSSSGTSDITEPGSPCSTSSDEGVAAIRGTSASPLPSLPKLAPSSQLGTRPQWPWTPPLAATACSTTAFKRLRGEPEAGTLPRSGAADPTSRGAHVKANGKTAAGGQHHHESQGKITEYFKTQIKPQQPKIKKTNEMVLVAKSSEFRRPPMVQRNKGGLAKYLGTVSSNTNRSTVTNEPWEVRTLTSSSTKKVPLVIVPRANGKIDKKLPKPLPSLPISNDVLKNLPKISSLRLTSDVSINSTKGSSPPATAASSLLGEPLDFKAILTKPHVNENNNLTNSCGSILGALRSQSGHESPISRLSPPSKEDSKDEDGQSAPIDVDEDDVDEEDSLGSESKPSPILSAPTTIRFPARAPEKDRSQATDSGICRWDKCEANFESVGGLLEHLQAAHINTQTGSDNFVCQWQGCKVQGRTSCSRRWLERHVLSHGGNKPFRCIVDGCGCRFSSQTALERHVNGHFNQPETSNTNGRRSCENGGKLVRRNGKKLRYRRQPWSARLFDYFDSGVMEGLQHRLLELATSRTQGRLAETPGNSMALTSQVLARRVEMDGKTKVLLRWYPQDIEPDEWVLESEVQSTKHVGIREAAASNPEQVSLALYPAISGRTPPTVRAKQRRKPVKNS
ncbi:PREDICTED: uncharacterized protein LOC108748381 isoform X2 [Trachymyrmex septentrionalis]|uniref:uncharacterized protein LOC108748381 isoform X2 n=1 Tax=Trachymyrmex septentrionalis TaxID=34720 RepID=UPI00084F7E70|nr:PREDICTED: uncharacterized protein LOC108748381 isoform X2 [Trachymyrmex septentrionalis]